MSRHSNADLHKKSAFTLAEVLITLGIIGVVAALTISSTITKIRNYQLRENYKVAYSILSQAVKKAIAEDVGNFANTATDYKNDIGYVNSSSATKKIYAEMQVVGTCAYNKVYNFNKTSDRPRLDWGTAYPRSALANGMCFNVNVNGGKVNLTIDTNGLKSPNRLGYDIFLFELNSNDQVVPKKMTKLLSEEELQIYKDRDGGVEGLWYSQIGQPCSYKSRQSANGIGCSWYALNNINPDDNSKKYWDSLPW